MDFRTLLDSLQFQSVSVWVPTYSPPSFRQWLILRLISVLFIDGWSINSVSFWGKKYISIWLMPGVLVSWCFITVRDAKSPRSHLECPEIEKRPETDHLIWMKRVCELAGADTGRIRQGSVRKKKRKKKPSQECDTLQCHYVTKFSLLLTRAQARFSSDISIHRLNSSHASVILFRMLN